MEPNYQRRPIGGIRNRAYEPGRNATGVTNRSE
jgi:hypothetical protein